MDRKEKEITPLTSFRSVPPPDTSCESCNEKESSTFDSLHGIRLNKVEASASSGCEHCRLRRDAAVFLL